MRASIDIGSNSILLLVGCTTPTGMDILVDEERIAGLGKDLDVDKKFIPESIRNAFDIFEEYHNIVVDKGIDPSEVIVTATEASRVASNAESFYKSIKDTFGFKVNIISGEGEAFYTGLGISLSEEISSNTFIAMDIGGASTELIKIKKEPFSIISSVSIPMGSVRATDWITEGSLENNIKGALKGFNLIQYECNSIVGVGGTMSCLAKAIRQMNSSSEGSVSCSSSQMNKFQKSFLEEKPKSLIKKFPFMGNRAATMNGGCQVALGISNATGATEFRIIDFGLRHGTLHSGEIKYFYLA